ncbi:hypothetical protein SRHO_G00088460, partial [Serrasalmus rhombeus]
GEVVSVCARQRWTGRGSSLSETTTASGSFIPSSSSVERDQRSQCPVRALQGCSLRRPLPETAALREAPAVRGLSAALLDKPHVRTERAM